MKLALERGTREVRVEGATAVLDGERVPIRPIFEKRDLVALEIDGAIIPVRVARQGGNVFGLVRGTGLRPRARNDPAAPARPSTTATCSPRCPDASAARSSRAGDTVSRGQVVMILEAMKMEHAIRAPRDGIVTRLAHAEGDLVEAGVALAEVTAPPS